MAKKLSNFSENFPQKVLKKITKKSKELTTEELVEQHWKQAEEKSKELIDQLLDRNLPVNWRPQDLDLEKVQAWRMMARDSYQGVPAYYQDEEELPSTEYLAEQITYHYILTLVERLLTDLAEFDCHDPNYFENLNI